MVYQHTTLLGGVLTFQNASNEYIKLLHQMNQIAYKLQEC